MDAQAGPCRSISSSTVTGTAGEDQLATLQRLTERSSVVCQTLASGPALSTSFARA